MQRICFEIYTSTSFPDHPELVSTFPAQVTIHILRKILFYVMNYIWRRNRTYDEKLLNI